MSAEDIKANSRPKNVNWARVEAIFGTEEEWLRKHELSGLEMIKEKEDSDECKVHKTQG